MTGLTYKSQYRFNIIAENEIGFLESNIVFSLAADLPTTPKNAPGFDPSETNTTSIRIVMEKILLDGGTPIISY